MNLENLKILKTQIKNMTTNVLSTSKEIYRCIRKGKGLKDILIRSNKSTKSFRGYYLTQCLNFEKIPQTTKF